MSETAYKKLQRVLEEAQIDPEYLALEAFLRQQEPQYEVLFQTLSREQQEILTAYWGTSSEMAHRLLELACFTEEG